MLSYEINVNERKQKSMVVDGDQVAYMAPDVNYVDE